MLVEFCYNCRTIGHGIKSCKQPLLHNQITNGDLYGAWLRGKADVYTVVFEGNYLRIVEIPRGEIFDTFSDDINTDARDGEDEVVAKDHEAENESEMLEDSELT
ncbi:hypothetical protein FEM48_Zijuj07G0041500 [Ziziphus jujuba var. spinosa]|uniref:CCHC-type domain-containing protein n=1 Tax=Ziziphus jujuba var. spinosa TaxID=714518 RepID=A0A978V2D0_ZIZJJ|nr:hypothetical protein FEM48_Zijuj07G0041500 [Ziziphus jujuba var. spinosa]